MHRLCFQHGKCFLTEVREYLRLHIHQKFVVLQRKQCYLFTWLSVLWTQSSLVSYFLLIHPSLVFSFCQALVTGMQDRQFLRQLACCSASLDHLFNADVSHQDNGTILQHTRPAVLLALADSDLFGQFSLVCEATLQ